MSDEWFKVKTIEECQEMATVDCYSEDECIAGWCTCLGDVFSEVDEVKIADEKVELLGFDQSHLAVVAVCKKNGKKIKVTLDSIELIKPTKAQKLWIEAYVKGNG